METRNITIVSTKNQQRYVVSTDATTLRELKAALHQQSIDYEGMTFYEGLSHTELLTDDAQLPHDVMYKGTPTNELVFMLTNPNKKIRSGVVTANTRQALYETIDALGLREECRKVYGKNVTQCKNSELMSLIEAAQDKDNSGDAAQAVALLVDILEDNEIISTAEAKSVRGVLSGTSADAAPVSPYSDKEIDNMFSFTK